MDRITARFQSVYNTGACTPIETSRRRAREVPVGIHWRAEPCPIHKIAGINMFLQVSLHRVR